MADGMTINMNQVVAIATRLQGISATMEASIDAILANGANAIAAEAKQRAPGDSGFLRNSIVVEKLGSMQYNVAALELYAAYVEFGTRANVSVPPELEAYAMEFIGSPGATALSAKEAIFNWCKRKGIDESAWYAIYITIMTKGGQPHPFFFPAVSRILPIIINQVTKFLVEDAFK